MEALEIKDSRILVIGGAGFIGSHLVDQLCQTNAGEIVVYDNFVRGTKSNLVQAMLDKRVTIFGAGGDVRDIDILNSAMSRIDYVFHLAALWLLQCYEYPRAAFDVNIGGTLNVLEACAYNKVKKLVYSSSASVYGNALTIPMNEGHPLNNHTFYGATKIAGEQMCRAFYEKYRLNYTGLRYMNVYGPRQDNKGAYVGVIVKMLNQIKDGAAPTIYGDGSQVYDFVYVEDVARANICALQADTTDQFYNVGMGTATTIRQLTQLLLESCGSSLEPQYVPRGLTFVTNRVGSVSKAKREIGFEAQVGIEAGIKKLVDWRNNR